MSLIKSRKRFADHGKVFTPAWMVDATLDLVKDESERVDSRFPEPACGSGHFIVKVLLRQLCDFRFDVLTGSSAFSQEGSLFAHIGKHEIFMPTKTWPPMTVSELVALEEN